MMVYGWDFDEASPESLSHHLGRSACDALGKLLSEAGHLQATQILMDFVAICCLLGG